MSLNMSYLCFHNDANSSQLHLQCTEEAHRPVDCDTVAMWILKNSAESENMNWYDIKLCNSNMFVFAFLDLYKTLSCVIQRC